MDGILLVDKPKGWTSFDAVAKVRGALRQAQQSGHANSHLDAVQGSKEERANSIGNTTSERQTTADAAMRQKPAGMPSFAGQQGKAMRIRVGHTGTLDPSATGLLVLLVGKATKQAPELSKVDKTYETIIKLGFNSSTGDEEGEKTKVSDKVLTLEEIQQVLLQFSGEIEQIPPAYSAVKVDGQRAYKLARQGKEVKIEPRKTTIYEYSNVSYKYPELRFTVKVSSGTYIRTLAEDIGKELGTGAYLTDLKRTEVGKYDLKDAISPENITAKEIYKHVRPM